MQSHQLRTKHLTEALTVQHTAHRFINLKDGLLYGPIMTYCTYYNIIIYIYIY